MLPLVPPGEGGGCLVKGLSVAPLDKGGKAPFLCTEQPEGRELDKQCTTDTMTTWLNPVQLERVALKSLAPRGALKIGRPISQSLRYFEWDISGRCIRPKMVELTSRPERRNSARWLYVGKGTPKPMQIDLLVRCRNCEPCLQQRRILWTERVKREFAGSGRTWLCTFTANPLAHARYEYAARAYCDRNGVDYDALPEEERFALLCRAPMSRSGENWIKYPTMGAELTNMVKRLRKNTKVPFRYLLVFEKHKSGKPHVHMLIHEQDVTLPLRKRAIEKEWRHGFTNVKLVDDVNGATYAAKYLSKSKCARVRASLCYGCPERTIENLSETNCTSDNNAQHFFAGTANGPSKTSLHLGVVIEEKGERRKSDEQISHSSSASGGQTELDIQGEGWRAAPKEAARTGLAPPAHNTYASASKGSCPSPRETAEPTEGRKHDPGFLGRTTGHAENP